MNIEQAKATIAVIAKKNKAFRPVGEPTLTPRGARIQFAVPDVKPEAVSVWFQNAGAWPLMIGFQDLYYNGGTMYAEFQEYVKP